MAHWRDTYRPARVFMIDARILFLVLPTLLHVRAYMVVPTVITAAILYYFEKRRDMNVPSSLRLMRSWLAGNVRPARIGNKLRSAIDYNRRGV